MDTNDIVPSSQARKFSRPSRFWASSPSVFARWRIARSRRIRSRDTDVLSFTTTPVSRLRALEASAGRVLSVCFELDPAIPTAATRAVQARGRLDEAARDLEREVPEPDQESLRAARETVAGNRGK